MKKLLVMLLVGVMSFSMVACGGSDANSGNDADTQADANDGTDADADADADTEGTTSDGDVVLHYWAQWSENESQAEVLKDAIARFEENNPGVTVDVNWAGRDVRDILRTSIDSGAEIDIVDSGYDQILSTLGEEYLMNITEYVEAIGLDKSISAGMASFTKSFASDGESWYYIPNQPFVGTLYYNKAIFAEAGIDALPTTWDEFYDCCQKIKDAGYDPITIDDAYMEGIYGGYLAAQKGVDWYTTLVSGEDSSLWDDPAVLEMAQIMQTLYEKGYFASSVGSNVFPAAQNGEFALGTAAIYGYNGSWLPNEVADITGDDFQWGAMFLPVSEGSVHPYTTYSTGCQFYGVTKGCEHPELAVALLAEFSSEQTERDLVEKAECISVIDGIDLPDNLACAGEIMSEGTDAIVWGGATSADSEVKAIMNAAFAELIGGEINAEEFVQSIKSQLQ